MKLFTAKNIAIVCPTKNQPNKVVRLLTSIAALHEKPQQIIVADGGHNLKPVIALQEKFKDNLSLLSRDRAGPAKESCTQTPKTTN